MGREGDQEVEEAIDARKAAGWSLLAGMARIGMLVAPDPARRPWPFDALLAIASALVLPAIAVLHARHGLVRGSGAMLATIAGIATVVSGLVAVGDPGLRSAAMLTLGIWWWTIGKMWVETDVLPRTFGILTAALGTVAIVAALLPAIGGPPDQIVPGPLVFDASQVMLAAWLVALSANLWRRADVPSR